MSRTVSTENLEQIIENLLDDYRDLQSNNAIILSEPPTSLETLRLINRSHPVIIRGFSPLTANAVAEEYDWSKSSTYRQIGGDKKLSVAITDDGLADSVRLTKDAGSTFVKPLEEKMSISTLIDKLGQSSTSTEAHYLQSQDGNIYRSTPHPGDEAPQLEMFQKYIRRDVQWMKEAVGSEAEAVNLWIGDSRSTTSLHHDPYENIYHVLAGSKTFTLISPIEGLWLDQHFHPPSTLHRTSSNSLIPIPDSPSAPSVPWVSSTTFPSRVQPIVLTVKEGETLYLPAGWWHRVEQQEGDEGIVVAVNYWYPAEINAEKYAYERLSKRIARLAGRNGVIPVIGDDIPEDVWGSEEEDSGSGEEWNPADWGR